MPIRLYLATGLVVVGSLVWAAGVSLRPFPWSRAAGSVIAAGLLVTATVAAVGVLLEGSRLGYWLAVWVTIEQAALAAARPVDVFWWLGMAALVATGAALVDPSLGGYVRRRSAPAPIPRQAVTLCLLLLGAGPFTALASVGSDVGVLMLLTFGAWLVLFAYVRRLPGREWWARLGAPLLGAGSVLIPPPARWIWMALLGAAAVMAWTRAGRLAVRPLLESSRAVPIPPELAPAAILEAAGQRPETQRRSPPGAK